MFLWSALDWLIPKGKHKVDIDIIYADDITFVPSVKSKINAVKRVIPKHLEEADLMENEDKKEEIVISKDSSPE